MLECVFISGRPVDRRIIETGREPYSVELHDDSSDTGAICELPQVPFLKNSLFKNPIFSKDLR